MISYRYIADKAARIIKYHGERNLDRLVKSMGIILHREPMGIFEGACKGFFMMEFRIKCITINCDLDEELQRVILAHEIGHAVLHAKKSGRSFHDVALFSRDDSRFETEANVFAAETLLRDYDVKQSLRANDTFYEVASELCVPPELLNFKMRTMKAKGIEVPESPIYAHGDFLRGV